MRRSADRAPGRRTHAGKTPPPLPESDWAWFFDVDGTLVEIAREPAGIVVHDDLPPLIEKLHVLCGGAVALITGRSIVDVDDLLPFGGMPLAGQHGLELRFSSGHITTHQVREEALEQLRTQLVEEVARHPGLLVEYKGLSIALHYRQAPRLGGYAHRLMNTLRSRYVPDFIVQKGKRVVELKPSGMDKGLAIREFMGEVPFAGRVPVFIGDDVTDETGFSVINEMGGHSVKVGSGRTKARWRVRDVRALRAWLSEGIERMSAPDRSAESGVQ